MRWFITQWLEHSMRRLLFNFLLVQNLPIDVWLLLHPCILHRILGFLMSILFLWRLKSDELKRAAEGHIACLSWITALGFRLILALDVRWIIWDSSTQTSKTAIKNTSQQNLSFESILRWHRSLFLHLLKFEGSGVWLLPWRPHQDKGWTFKQCQVCLFQTDIFLQGFLWQHLQSCRAICFPLRWESPWKVATLPPVSLPPPSLMPCLHTRQELNKHYCDCFLS